MDLTSFLYNPLYSLLRFVYFLCTGRVTYPDNHTGSEFSCPDSNKYTVFLEMSLLDKKKNTKRGSVVFMIFFRPSHTPADVFIKQTKLTLPFFAGLPGFCTKQFMVNKADNSFSGRYEWESAAHAQKYAGSYAAAWMKKISGPFPVYYEIRDTASNTIIESKIL